MASAIRMLWAQENADIEWSARQAGQLPKFSDWLTEWWPESLDPDAAEDRMQLAALREQYEVERNHFATMDREARLAREAERASPEMRSNRIEDREEFALVVKLYNEFVADGELHPVKAVYTALEGEKFGYSRSTLSKWIARGRELGKVPPPPPTLPGRHLWSKREKV